MKKTKKLITLSLATCIALSPFTVNAHSSNIEEKSINPISAPIDKEDKTNKEKMPDYIKYEGKISKINKNGQKLSILVKNDENDPYEGNIFHINKKVILLNNETKDFISADKLKVGMTVTAYYDKNTPVALSLPGQLTPDAIIVNESKDSGFIYVSKFSYRDKNLVSTDNQLQINFSDNIIIVDQDGNKLELEDIVDKDLIVFYTTSTKSIPAQTTPEKIIVIEKEGELEKEPSITVLDKIIINEKEITLDRPLYKNEKGVLMIPLRQIAKALGYEIKWNNETRTAELTNGAQWTSITIGKDNYNFAKMLIGLGTAPEVKDSLTYVPFTFLKEVLRVGVKTTEKGIIEIGQ